MASVRYRLGHELFAKSKEFGKCAKERMESRIDSANGVVCRLKIRACARIFFEDFFKEFKHSRQKNVICFMN